MPHKKLTTVKGRRFLRGPKLHVRKRGLKPLVPQDDTSLVFDNGHILNIPESKIFRALTELNIPFDAQVQVGPARELGSGLVDFWLPVHGVVIEFNGPFHNTDEGKARDFIRETVRYQRLPGIREIVYMGYGDLPRLKSRILELIGQSAIYGVTTKR
jgi:hypothetical protein